jgi:hypothetical protein
MYYSYKEEMGSGIKVKMENEEKQKKDYDRYLKESEGWYTNEKMGDLKSGWFHREREKEQYLNKSDYQGYQARNDQWLEWLLNQPELCQQHLYDLDDRIDNEAFKKMSDIEIRDMVTYHHLIGRS